MSDDEWDGGMPPDPIAEPAGPGEPVDSVIILAGDDGRSYQYEGDGRVHQHDEWRLVCVQATPTATEWFETWFDRGFSSDALCLTLADGTVVASGVVKAVGQQVETLYITVAAPTDERGETNGG